MTLDYASTKLKQVTLLVILLLCMEIQNTIQTVVSYELKLVSRWLRLNKLSLNVGKWNEMK